ncbi:MAG TPA: class I SAM-dependent methyltransferase [Phycisphaerae bacterium]|nr:class I SAM-dependent methyltransferase [Phycisphaerae bacterium]
MDQLEAQLPLISRLLQEKPSSIVDLGAGLGQHTRCLLEHDLRVTAVDHVLTAELADILRQHPGRARFVRSDLATLPLADGQAEAVWVCHCLEHMNNPLAALREWRRVIRPEGLLAVTVPPYKTEIVGRHVFTGWNVGQLMLTLLRTGFRISDGAFAEIGYNVFALVRRDDNPSTLEPNDEILCRHADRFPPQIAEEIRGNQRPNPFGETISSFEGRIKRLGW